MTQQEKEIRKFRKDLDMFIVSPIGVSGWTEQNEEELKDYWIKEIGVWINNAVQEAKREVLEEVLKKKTNYKIEKEEHGYRVTLEYVLVDDIEKELDNIKQSKNNG